MSLTGLAFVAMYAAGLLAALVRRPIYGLYTYMAVFYLHPPSRWWGAGLPGLRWSLLAALVTLMALALNPERRSFNPQGNWYGSTLAKGLILYTLWMWLQVFWVDSPWHMEGAILFTKYLLLFALIVTIVDNEEDFGNFCLAHVIGCAFLGYLVYIAPDGGRLEGVGGPGIDNANTLGMHLATGLFFGAFLLLFIKDKRRWILFLGLPLILNGIIQTQTRGAMVGVFLGGLFTWYLKPKQFNKQFYAYSALAFVALLFVANEAFVERMETLRAGVDEQSEWDNSAASRIEIAKAQLEMFGDYPLGAGHQGTAYLSRGYMDEKWFAAETGDRASHNTILSVLVDQGLPGILIFSALGISVLRMLRRMKKLDKSGFPGHLGLYRTMLGGTIVVIFGAGMFAQYLKAEVQIWTFALLAILQSFSLRFEADMRGGKAAPGREGQKPLVAGSRVVRNSRGSAHVPGPSARRP